MATNPRIEGLTDWRPLARGGFAIVWEARQESLNRLVAVKVDSRKLDTPAERERFLREAGAAGRLSGHPGIVTVHDAGLLDDDRPYLVMELCTGGSLTRRLAPEARPSQEWVRDVGIRIADALAAAHAAGVLHRDVKPANVLIDQYGHAGLADFGLAVLPDPDAEPEELDALTPAYAPPEAFAAHAPTEGGDVYSLAATLYALLGGGPPRALDDGQAEVESMVQRLAEPVERLPDVDPALMDTLLSASPTTPRRGPARRASGTRWPPSRWAPRRSCPARARWTSPRPLRPAPGPRLPPGDAAGLVVGCRRWRRPSWCWSPWSPRAWCCSRVPAVRPRRRRRPPSWCRWTPARRSVRRPAPARRPRPAFRPAAPTSRPG